MKSCRFCDPFARESGKWFHAFRSAVLEEVALSAIRLAVTVVSAAVTMSRHPAVRAGINAVANNPKAREVAVTTTRNVAYNAGVIARHIIGRRAP